MTKFLPTLVVLSGGTGSIHFPRLIVEINSAVDRVLNAGNLYNEGKAGQILLTGGNNT